MRDSRYRARAWYSRSQVGAPLAPSAQANLPPKSCARVNKLLVRPIRGTSWKRSAQPGQDFLRTVLVPSLLFAYAPHNGRDDMVLCDNVFCSGEVIEFEYIATAGRKFCCVACSDAWRQQNEALAEAARPLREAFKEDRRGNSMFASRRTALT